MSHAELLARHLGTWVPAACNHQIVHGRSGPAR